MQRSSLKIVSLNIEKDRHLDRIIPFLKEQQLDVILLQEVFDSNVPYFEKALEMKSVFTPLNFLPHEGGKIQLGLLTLSALPIFKSYSNYYKGDGTDLPLIQPSEGPERMARAVLVTEIIKEDQSYCLINTHFTWTPDGQPSNQQKKDLSNLFQCISKIPEFVFCGDFNAPRGTIIFDTIALKYKDNIPSHVTTTIDKNLHKSGDLNLVVDGLFTTLKYQVDSVEIIDGLSDHCAVLARIKKMEISKLC